MYRLISFRYIKNIKCFSLRQLTDNDAALFYFCLLGVCSQGDSDFWSLIRFQRCHPNFQQLCVKISQAVWSILQATMREYVNKKSQNVIFYTFDKKPLCIKFNIGNRHYNIIKQTNLFVISSQYLKLYGLNFPLSSKDQFVLDRAQPMM